MADLKRVSIRRAGWGRLESVDRCAAVVVRGVGGSAGGAMVVWVGAAVLQGAGERVCSRHASVHP